MPDHPPLLVLAASARAIARSCERAGRSPVCFDFFADADTPRVTRVDAEATAVDRTPGTGPLIYGGGFENRPAVLARIARTRPILGTTGPALVAARGGFAALSRQAGCRLPEETAVPPAGGDWWWKPTDSAGGCFGRDRQPGRRGRWQRHIDGESFGAAFLATGHRPGLPEPPDVTPLGAASLGAASLDVELLGVVRQFPTGGRGKWPFFAMDLVHDPAAIVPDPIRRLAERLAAAGVSGPFGVDYLLTPGGEVVALECNPRFTAGMELLERGCGRSIIGDWLDGPPRGGSTGPQSGGQSRPQSGGANQPQSGGRESTVWGRRIVLADRDLVSTLIPTDTRCDVPPPGTPVVRGQPWCSVFAAAETVERCRGRLTAAADAIARRSHSSGSPSRSIQ